MKLMPLKEEVLFLKPKIVLYYDVLSDEEIEVIKGLATPRVIKLTLITLADEHLLQFKRATVQNYKTGELETANYRISKTAWLKREEDPAIEKVYRRVADVTGN